MFFQDFQLKPFMESPCCYYPSFHSDFSLFPTSFHLSFPPLQLRSPTTRSDSEKSTNPPLFFFTQAFHWLQYFNLRQVDDPPSEQEVSHCQCWL